MKTLILFLSALLVSSFLSAQAQDVNSNPSVAPVALQLKAYNNRDIDMFMEAYSDTVKVYGEPGKLQYQGKEEMRKRYAQMFDQLPDLHCQLVNRIVSGDVVIDHERVRFSNNRPLVEAIAIYRVKEGKITEVTFISPKQQTN